MTQHYSDPKRANDPHALPNLETFYIGRADLQDDWREFALERMRDGETLPSDLVGWYWWACFPGCLPDSDPIGPFASEADALADAREGMDDDGEDE